VNRCADAQVLRTWHATKYFVKEGKRDMGNEKPRLGILNHAPDRHSLGNGIEPPTVVIVHIHSGDRNTSLAQAGSNVLDNLPTARRDNVPVGVEFGIVVSIPFKRDVAASLGCHLALAMMG
jgi:hypothetical protein